MDKINRLSKEEFDLLIGGRKPIGSTSGESIVYKISDGIILKLLKSEALKYFKDFSGIDYTEDQLLKFSCIKSRYYYFINGVIYVDGELLACLMRECSGYSLNFIDPLSINLTNLLSAVYRFNKATLAISKKHIKGFDMQSNYMYDGINFGAIDTIHYDYSDSDVNDIYRFNITCFNDELSYLLTDFYFNDFIDSDYLLMEMINSIRNGELIDISLFIKQFRKKLEEYSGRRIVYLSDAKEAIRENDSPIYPGCPIYKVKKIVGR